MRRIAVSRVKHGSDERETTAAAIEFAVRKAIVLDHSNLLGWGQDGQIWASSRNTAVKAFFRENNYKTERDCYLRLQEFEVTELAGFTVPQLIGFDDQLLIVEMGIVTPPRILDFAKAHLNRPADYPEYLLEDSMEQFRSLYSADDWERVQEVVAELESMLIFYYDLRPGNIQVRRDSED